MPQGQPESDDIPGFCLLDHLVDVIYSKEMQGIVSDSKDFNIMH
jgi:hypothetical protein